MRHLLVATTLLLLSLVVIWGVASVLEMRAEETQRDAPAIEAHTTDLDGSSLFARNTPMSPTAPCELAGKRTTRAKHGGARIWW
jgi:hypothetical protein